MNFQDIISALSAYWGRQQCINFHPYDVEKGAGTMNGNFPSRLGTGAVERMLCGTVPPPG